MKDPLAHLSGCLLRRASAATLAELNGRLACPEERGRVQCNRTDGRSQGLSLTAAGRALLAKANTEVEVFEETLLARVPARLRPMVVPSLTALWNPKGD